MREAPRQHGHRELRGGDRVSLRAGGPGLPRLQLRPRPRGGARAAPAPRWRWSGTRRPALPAGLDLVAIPGGFSFGDYLRCGAIAARSPIMRAVVGFAGAGGLRARGLQRLPGADRGGAPARRADAQRRAEVRLRHACRSTVATTDSAFTAATAAGETIRLPIAHHDGNYFADPATLAGSRTRTGWRFRYAANPNGSAGRHRRHPLGRTAACSG